MAGDGVEGGPGESRAEGRDEKKKKTLGGEWGRGGDGGDGGGSGGGGGGGSKTSVEWEAVQKDLEEERRRRVEARKATVEGGEKSLYEILQANKAAKQAAFEEQNRIRNQFRALDDDEIEFLHGVSDEKRAEEERVRRETEDRLASFRKAQQLAGGSGGDDDAGGDAAGVDDGDAAVAEEWTAAAGRKRKREREKGGLKGIRRKTGVPDGGDKEQEKAGDQTASEEELGGKKGGDGTASSTTTTKLAPASTTSKPGLGPSGGPKTDSSPVANGTSKPKTALGLVDYGSDEEDDD